MICLMLIVLEMNSKHWLKIIIVSLIAVLGIFAYVKMAKAWQGSPSNPHTKMGTTLIQRSMFNRLAK